MKAILRNRDEWVNTHKNKIKLHDEQYPCWQPDELDGSEFNFIILVGDELYKVTSTDFDFTNK